MFNQFPVAALFLVVLCAPFEVYGFRRSQRLLSDPCVQPADYGGCNAQLLRYYYDGDRCNTFYYSGCGGNGNNFWSHVNCRRVCGEKSSRAMQALSRQTQELSEKIQALPKQTQALPKQTQAFTKQTYKRKHNSWQHTWPAHKHRHWHWHKHWHW